jgi:hypothetical protein
VEPSHRSIVPNIPGVPWWAAVLVAVGSTAVGYAFDAGHKELTHTFAGFYIAGCVAAILAVRQAAVFTAVIQPPLILFCTVPGAYWLFHGGKVDKFKDLLINCGYPLIERFPLMLGTAGGVLLIGLIRWFLGKNSHLAATTEDSTAEDPVARTPLISGLVAKLSSLLAGGSSGDSAGTADADAAGSPPARTKGRTATTSRSARTGSRSAQRPARTRSRHARPDDAAQPDGERPRRRSAVPPEYADYDPTQAGQRPRRRRPPGEADLGGPPPREMRREPPPRRSSYERTYERPEPRSRRFDPYDRPEPPERGERRSRHERRGSGYEPSYEPPYEPRPRRAAPSGNPDPNHHPISQVRYRGQPPRNEPRDEPRSERRSRSQRGSSPRRPEPESWDYDA